MKFYKSKIIIIGSTGLLGSYIEYFFKSKLKHTEIITASRSKSDYILDLMDNDNLFKLLDVIRPDIVINCAGEINFDNCKNNFLDSWKINTLLPNNINDWCNSNEAKFIQISTDHYYVSELAIKHKENDQIIIVNDYALQKISAERLISKNHLILRTNFTGLKSKRQTLAKWAEHIVKNNINSILFEDYFTSTIDLQTLTESIIDLIETNAEGLYNIACNEVYSKKEFVLAVASHFKINYTNYKTSSVNDILIKRANSLGLDTDKLERKIGKKMPNLSEVIKRIYS